MGVAGRVGFWLHMSAEPALGGGDPGRRLVLGGPGSGGAAPSRTHLVEAAAVPGEAPELALQVDDAGFPPDHLDP